MSITFRIGKDEKCNKRYLQNCPMENMSLAILMTKETKTHFQTVR